jgi:hypothetical protein
MKDMPSSLPEETGGGVHQEYSGSGDNIGATSEAILNLYKGIGDLYHNVISRGATFGDKK